MNKVKELLGIGAPGGVDDLVVRAVKTAISTFGGLVGADLFGFIGDATTVRNATIVAAAAGANVLLNAVLLWAAKR